jgi:hypothetical protein
MTRPTALLAALLALSGCASKATMDARYDASLQRWKGATRAELEAAWGKPRVAQAANGDTVLTWVVRTDIDDRQAPGAPPIVTVASTGLPGAGGMTVSTASPAMVAPAVVPITCTTHFTLKDGRVAAWTFEGLGCGAPT